MEEVKRELNEAIQKEMEMPNIINNAQQDEYFEGTGLYGGGPMSARSNEEEVVSRVVNIQATKKEIVLNAEQFKLVQQSKQ